MASQICYRCKVSKHLVEFVKHKGICKNCLNKENRERKKKWKEEVCDKDIHCKYCDKECRGLEMNTKQMCNKCHDSRSYKAKSREREKRKETDASQICSICKEFLKYSNFTQQKEMCNKCVYQRTKNHLSNSERKHSGSQICYRCKMSKCIDDFVKHRGICKNC